MTFQIRPAAPEDAEQIAEAHLDSIHTLGARVYASGIVAVWGSPRNGDRYRKSIEDGVPFFVAQSIANSRLPGFSAYGLAEGKHRTAIYVRAEAARMGVGRALFQAAEAVAHERGADEIHVDASLGAVPFYLACGFEELEKGQHQLSSGLLMDCVFMKKRLARHA